MTKSKKDNGTEITGENMIATPWMERSQHIQPPTNNTKGDGLKIFSANFSEIHLFSSVINQVFKYFP